ncbi:hypothetical protein [Atopomonas hussainii]|uniref:hypothetical protein n=1 Tax=Atopomonas hussainii TaxID=1429083 RepID=UPI0009001909|nr:hypothetical protein [Atopomonas hussainii]
MKRCLYCNHSQADSAAECERCGMALPESEASSVHRKQRWFVLFWLALVVFCFVMFFALPR